jgi:hypothetical protein
MLFNVMQNWDTLVDVVTDVEHLATSLDVLDDTGKIKPAWQRRVVTRLSRYVDKHLAEAAIRRMIHVDTGERSYSQRKAQTASRTVEDIFITLMRMADGQYPEIRENLERAAYDVLAKKLQLWE